MQSNSSLKRPLNYTSSSSSTLPQMSSLSQSSSSMRKCFSLIDDLMEHDAVTNANLTATQHHHQYQQQQQQHHHHHFLLDDPIMGPTSGANFSTSTNTSSSALSFKTFLSHMAGNNTGATKPGSTSSSLSTASNDDLNTPMEFVNGTGTDGDNLVASLHALPSSLPLLIASTSLLDTFETGHHRCGGGGGDGHDDDDEANNLNSINFDVDFLSEDSILYKNPLSHGSSSSSSSAAGGHTAPMGVGTEPSRAPSKLLSSIDPNLIRFEAKQEEHAPELGT